MNKLEASIKKDVQGGSGGGLDFTNICRQRDSLGKVGFQNRPVEHQLYMKPRKKTSVSPTEENGSKSHSINGFD